MLNRLKISTRLVVLIAVQITVLGLVGAVAITALNNAFNTTALLNTSVIEQVKLNQLNETVRGDLLETVNRAATGKLSWEALDEALLAARNLFVNNWDEYKEEKTPEQVRDIEASLGAEYKAVLAAFDRLREFQAARDREGLAAFVESELPRMVNPFLLELNERVAEQQLASEALFESSLREGRLALWGAAGVVVVGLLVAGLLGYLIYLGINRSIRRIQATVAEVSEGNYYARTGLTGTDELAELGGAFDALLEDKVASLVQAEQENERLNESVIALLEAVSRLSQRDLTIKVPVTEDVTGPVADALNQLTSETSRVLKGVRRISEEVARASAMVKAQSDNVIAVAAEERREVEETARELAHAVETMAHIAALAEECDRAAEQAIRTTHTALETVTRTVEGINGIRETIHETEKRIKRLGERSQEISRAVNLINSISERTHILALNASMHAASAGEAGKSFAVVADEVQRLAESARDATAQISTLVSNIQVETADTVATMNEVITQVVEGTRLAQEAGQQMQRTEESTASLVEAVRRINERSQDQARLSNALQGRAGQIQESTRKTSRQLQEQTQQTTRLVEYARGLLNAVNVFRLPEGDAAPGLAPLAPAPAGGELEKKAS